MSIFEGFLANPEVLEAFGERHFLAAMLRFEASLATAQARAGLIPDSAAQTIVEHCKIELFDVSQIVRDSGRAGTLAIPLMKRLKAMVALARPEALRFVHFGSTSQDVIDTALALVTREVLTWVQADLQISIDALMALAERHAADPILARTLLQPASVTSFGLKCAGWVAPLIRSQQRLQVAAANALCLQLGGAVGTLAHMKAHGPEVIALMAADLQLKAPLAPWHTQRDEWVALGCELGLLVGSLGKIARDISLMGQFEVNEVSEPTAVGRGGSSAMPHKRNPVACMLALVAAQRAPQRVAALLAAMPQEHERALSHWQTEFAEWPDLLLSVQASARAMAEALPGLQVDSGRMLANLQALRTVLPADAADEWFNPALALHAAELTRAQLTALQALKASNASNALNAVQAADRFHPL